jgi:formate hydrogenlyase subunit 6/NADH:ubiquinone oxidoreductase subunit I
MDCPANAIELITVDKEHGQFEMHYDVSRCIFCAQCVQNCRFGCIQLSSDDWELASDEKGAFLVQYMDSSGDE